MVGVWSHTQRGEFPLVWTPVNNFTLFSEMRALPRQAHLHGGPPGGGVPAPCRLALGQVSFMLRKLIRRVESALVLMR